MSIKVKALEWVMMYDGSTYHAKSILGRWARWDGHYLPPDGYGGIRCDDPISAAQADYERRILSALEPSPAPDMRDDGKWEIDRTTDSPILMYEKCSVIQDEQALFVMALIRGASPAPDMREAVEALEALEKFVWAADEASGAGLMDAIDNSGKPYQSQWLADLLDRARTIIAEQQP